MNKLVVIVSICAIQLCIAADKGLFDKEFPRKETLYLTGEQYAAPTGFNPLAESWMTSWPIGNDYNLVYETLVSFNSLTRELEPLLGAIDETLSNNDSVVVCLNPAARWSDGRTVSSDDVLFTFLKSPNVSAQRAIKDIHVKKNAKNGDQISFIANKNEYGNPLTVKTLLQNVKIVPSHIFAPLMETYGAEELKKMSLMDEKLVSSGPYTIESISDEKIALVRRDDYWGNKALHDGDKPAPKYIVHPIVSSNDENSSLLRKGAIDISGGWIDVRKLKQDGIGTWLDHSPFFTPGTVVTLVVNAIKTPLENKVFRRALAASIDYLSLSDVSVMGYSPKVFPGLIMPYGYEKKFVNVRDIKKYGVKFGGNKTIRNKNVQEMLSSIGITSVWDGDSLLYMEENGRRLPTLYITTPAGWNDWETMVDAAVDGMRSAGIDVRKNLVDAGGYWAALGLGNFDLIMHKPAAAVNPSQLWSRFDEIMSSRNWTPLGKWAGVNFGRYNDPETYEYRPDVDELLSSIPFMNDSLEIKKAYSELNKIFMEDQPAIPLVYMPEQFYEFNSRVWTNWPTMNNPTAPPLIPGHGSSTNMLWNLKLRR